MSEFGNGYTEIVKDPSDEKSVMKAWRKLKKRLNDDGLFREIRERQEYTKPSVKRARAKAAARKRWLRKVDSMREEGRWIH